MSVQIPFSFSPAVERQAERRTALAQRDARALRDEGIERASDRAERLQPDWKDMAYDHICRYARITEEFISEDCTNAAREWGLVSPGDERAWGHPFRRAAKAGIIQKIGYGVSTRRHLSPTPKWRSLVFRSAA